MTHSSDAPVQHEIPPEQMRRVVFGGSAGMFVEFFDYGIYGFLATTLAVVFFHPKRPRRASS